MFNVFTVSFYVPGTAAGDWAASWMAPFDCQLIHVSAVCSDANAAGIEVDQDADYGVVFLGGRSQSRWDLQVPAGAALRIGTTLNAASATIDPGSGPITRVSGTWNASDATVDLADATAEGGIHVDAVRLDSGDLLAGARAIRDRLDQRGHPEIGVFLSGDLDEYRLAALMAAMPPEAMPETGGMAVPVYAVMAILGGLLCSGALGFWHPSQRG